METNSNNVKVGVRIRPLVPIEIENGSHNAVQTGKDPRVIAVNAPGARNGTFTFDWVFPPTAQQSQLYETLCRPLVDKIFEGFNATVFAYGQTGSGKTFTMGNAATSLQGDGIIALAMNDIFRKKAVLESEGGHAELHLSYIEVYMEEIYDLLAPPPTAGNDRHKLDLRETTKGETIIDGLTLKPIADVAQVGGYLAEAAQYRTVSGTAMNAHSSRSHAICTLSLRITDKEGHNLVSKLHLVDLAGSERAKKTMATGDVFNEGVSINKSLFALGNVVSALASISQAPNNATVFVPYRDSKLTRLLKDALGGNGLTVMLACVSPADSNAEETVNTLRFASRASSIVNAVKVNHDDDGLDNEGLKKEVAALRQQCEVLQMKCQMLSALKSSGSATMNNASDSSNGNLAVVPALSADTVAVSQQSQLLNASQLKISSLEGSQQSLVNALYILVASFKNLLVSCLEEGVALDDDLLDEIREHIATMYTDLKACGAFAKVPSPADPGSGRPSDASTGSNVSSSLTAMEDDLFSDNDVSLDFLPPIVVLIDKLTTLLMHLHKVSESLNPNTANSSSSDSAIASALLLPAHTVSSSSELVLQSEMNAVNAQEAMAVEGIHKKQVEIEEMIGLTEKFEVTIAQLKTEISTLEKDKNRLQSTVNRPATASAPSFGGRSVPPVSAADEARAAEIRKELREKTRVLEDKVKELKQKEFEYLRVTQQKERLSKESETLHRELEESKKKRVELARMMKADLSLHQAEKTKLQHAEMASRKRELAAQASLQDLKMAADMKERVLKGQLAARERESKQLKELVEKQKNAKAYRENIKAALTATGQKGAFPAVTSMAVNANGGVVNGQQPLRSLGELPINRITELRSWIVKETETQALRFNTQEDIQREIELRGKAARQLQILRSGANKTAEDGNSNPVNTTANDAGSLETKMLEEEVRRRSVKISQKQGELADLGTVVEKKRFANVTDLKEAKFVMEWMFEKITKDNANARKALENKVAAQKHQIETLKRQLSAQSSSTSASTVTGTENDAPAVLSKRKASDLNECVTLMQPTKAALLNRTTKYPTSSLLAAVPAAPAHGSNANSGNTKLQSAMQSLTAMTAQLQQAKKKRRASEIMSSTTAPAVTMGRSSLLLVGGSKAPLLGSNKHGQSSIKKADTGNNAVHTEPTDASKSLSEAIDVTEEGDSVDFQINIDEDEVLAHHHDDGDDDDNDDGSEQEPAEESYALDDTFLTMDETFIDDDDDEDYSPEEEARQLRQNQRKAKPIESAEVLFTKTKRPVNVPLQDSTKHAWNQQNIQANSAVDNVDPSAMLGDKPLSKCTVKELKALLSANGLVVSGLKEDLIKRLMDHYHYVVDLAGATGKPSGNGVITDNNVVVTDLENVESTVEANVENSLSKKKRLLGTATIVLDADEAFVM